MKTYSDIIEPIARHTAGPWLTSKDAVPVWHTQITVYAEDGGERIATVFGTKANANLISSAPDLLEALKRITSRAGAEFDQSATHDGLKNSEIIAKAREAIRKAENGD